MEDRSGGAVTAGAGEVGTAVVAETVETEGTGEEESSFDQRLFLAPEDR